MILWPQIKDLLYIRSSIYGKYNDPSIFQVWDESLTEFLSQIITEWCSITEINISYLSKKDYV